MAGLPLLDVGVFMKIPRDGFHTPMKAVIYLLTALVIICDLLLLVLIVLALQPEQGANMVMMAAPIVIWPSFLTSIAMMLWLKKLKATWGQSDILRRFHAASCACVLWIPILLELFVW